MIYRWKCSGQPDKVNLKVQSQLGNSRTDCEGKRSSVSLITLWNIGFSGGVIYLPFLGPSGPKFSQLIFSISIRPHGVARIPEYGGTSQLFLAQKC